MGTRQPTHVAQPVYGLSDGAMTDDRSRAPSAVLPLMLLFAALAAAAVWFVALPAFAKPVRAERTCEVIVLKTGTTKCVHNATHRSRATSDSRKTR
jgi:hypothetical protein